MKRKVVLILSVMVLLAVFWQGVYASGEAYDSTTEKVIQQIDPANIIIGIKDTSITANPEVVTKTLPSTSPGIFILAGDKRKVNPDIVNKFIEDYKKKYPDKKVFQYYFYYENNETVYEPYLYDNVDFVVVSPSDEKELNTYLDKLKGRKVVVVENYLVASSGNNTTIERFIPIEKLIELHKEGKIVAVMFPFYQIEKDGSQKLYDTIMSDAEKLRENGIPTIGIVQPYIEFFTGTVNLPKTLGSLALSRKMFGASVYLSWDNLPAPLLYYLDPSKFECSSGSSLNIDWKKASYYLGLIPASIIVLIFIVSIAKKKGNNKKKEKHKEKSGAEE